MAALIPLSMLAVSKRILDAVQNHFAGAALPSSFWYLVAAEFALAALGSTLGRCIGYFDALLRGPLYPLHEHSRNGACVPARPGLV